MYGEGGPMSTRNAIRFVCALFLALLTLPAFAQATRRRAVPSAPVPPAAVALWNRYQMATFDSAVYQRWNVRPLFPLVPDPNGEVLVATLTSHGHVPDGEIWVTAVPEVQTICRAFSGDVEMKLRQLIGLPPDEDISHALVLRVHASDVFRPSPWPDTSTRYPCAPSPSDPATLPSDCGNAFPPNATLEHQAWIASADLSLHAVPGGYPWTHLGYTYNWAPGADRYGASEYIIRKDPKHPIVLVSDVSPIAYCSTASASGSRSAPSPSQ